MTSKCDNCPDFDTCNLHKMSPEELETYIEKCEQEAVEKAALSLADAIDKRIAKHFEQFPKQVFVTSKDIVMAQVKKDLPFLAQDMQEREVERRLAMKEMVKKVKDEIKEKKEKRNV